MAGIQESPGRWIGSTDGSRFGRAVAFVLVVWCAARVDAALVQGTVIDSEENVPVAHARVASDSEHFTYTDSTGAFSLQTEVSSGMAPEARGSGSIAWDPRKAAFSWSPGAGVVSIRIRNAQGALLASHRRESSASAGSWSPSLPIAGVYFASILVDGQVSARVISVPEARLRAIEPDRWRNPSAARSEASAGGAVLTVRKATYLPATLGVAGSSTNLVVKLAQDHGRSRHDFLFAGEYQGMKMTNQKMYVVRGGKIDWSFNLAGSGVELDDVWLLSNGEIVYSKKTGAAGISMADSKQQWVFSNTSVDLHTCQPLGLDRVLLMANNNPAQAIIYNTRKGAIEKTMTVPTGGTSTHAQVRFIRMTKAGTLLVAHMDMGKVVEYDTTAGSAKLVPIWSYVSGNAPWAAVRLKNGNTLVSGNGAGWVREISPAGKVVWEVAKNDLPGIALQTVQQCVRLENGNTVICSWNGGTLGTDEIAVVEVTPAKKVVWQFPVSWLGPATSIQLLDEPGVPEIVGDLQR